MDHELIIVLERLADHFSAIHGDRRVIVHINSGSRCPEWNRREGGADTSQHLFGRAADFWCEVETPDGGRRKLPDDAIADYLEAEYPDRYGIGRYVGRTHVDTRTNGPARWDTRP